jgi:hypothetical protein
MLVLLLSIAIALTFTPSICSANDQRPFWTEQASFTFDNTLYAIGVATNAASVEAGRQAAFEHGLDEIRNYGQVASLDGLLIETQMTFEQPQNDGRVSVWRLLKVSMGELRVLKATKIQTAVSHIRTTQEVPRVVLSTEPSHTAAGSKPHTPKAPVGSDSELSEVRAEARLRLAVTTTRQPAVNLPAIPLRYPQIITGWTQDTHGRIGVQLQERPDWYVPVLKASDVTYARR